MEEKNRREKTGAKQSRNTRRAHMRCADGAQPQRDEKAARPRQTAKISSLLDGSAIPEDSAEILRTFDDIIADVCGLSGKQRLQLAGNIKRLSHELTDERSSRRVGYMNDAPLLGAYISYFLWWNLVRLVRLFSNLPTGALNLGDGSVAIDVGSGPLTAVTALWLARPELRQKKITWYCLDLSQSALAQGENVYLSVAAKTKREPWHIIRVKGPLGAHIKERADFVSCANVFNEIVQRNGMPLDFLAKKYAGDLEDYLKSSENERSVVFLAEPGDPHSARFVSLMRDALIRRGFLPVSPCPHSCACPMGGRKSRAAGGKWCNFAFGTEDAPQRLLALSEKAGLPKERAVLSFVLAQKNPGDSNGGKIPMPTHIPGAQDESTCQKLRLRVASDAIKLPQIRRNGFYCCSELGLVLAIDERNLRLRSGDLIEVPFPSGTPETDRKSGALQIRT